MTCECSDWKRCTCEAWNHPSSIEDTITHYVHSESCPLYYS